LPQKKGKGRRLGNFVIKIASVGSRPRQLLSFGGAAKLNVELQSQIGGLTSYFYETVCQGLCGTSQFIKPFVRVRPGEAVL